MENKFEEALLKWGAKVLIDIRDLAECMEWYEDCAEINRILQKYDIKNTFDLGDWQNEFWKRGTSGNVALSNIGIYYWHAVNLLYGDKIDEITAPYKHIKLNRL